MPSSSSIGFAQPAARALGLVQVDQGEAIGVVESAHRILNAVAVRIGLDHRPDLATGCARACCRKVVTHCGKVDLGADGTGHGTRCESDEQP
jgi:hypothetical protein